MNISDKGALVKITRHEQFISESPLTPNIIDFGYRSFRVSHEDYEFYRIINESSVDTIQYDLATKSFSSDPHRFVSQ